MAAGTKNAAIASALTIITNHHKSLFLQLTMSRDLIQNLITEVKKIAKQRHFFCEYLIRDNEGKIICFGSLESYPLSHTAVDMNFIQKLKTDILQRLQQENSDCSKDFSPINVILTLLVELEDKFSESIDAQSEQIKNEFDKLLAELSAEWSLEEKVKYTYFMDEFCKVRQKLFDFSLPDKEQQQIIENELFLILNCFPDSLLQNLLAYHSKLVRAFAEARESTRNRH